MLQDEDVTRHRDSGHLLHDCLGRTKKQNEVSSVTKTLSYFLAKDKSPVVLKRQNTEETNNMGKKSSH